MNLDSEIFTGFFAKISASKQIPKPISAELERRFNEAVTTSQDELLQIIKLGCDNDNKNQNN